MLTDVVKAKRGTNPTMRMRATDGDGNPVDLTDTVATLWLRREGDSATSRVIDVLQPPTAGYMQWQLPDTLAKGEYDGEVDLVRAGVKLTAPTSGHFRLIIEADIA